MNTEQSTDDRTTAPVHRGSDSATGAAKLVRARELHQRGLFDAAAVQYEALLAQQPDDADTLHLYGIVQHQRGRAAESEALLRRAVSLSPAPTALADLGAVIAGSGRVDEAVGHFEAALRIDPRHIQTLVRLGNTLIGLREYERALNAYDRALAVSPLVVDALCNRGSALRALGRYLEALETYDRALTVDPRSFESFCNRGHVLRDLQRQTEALQSYNSALALMPGNAAVLSMRGRTLIELGRVQEALVSFNEAIAIQPGFVEALYNSAVALERLNRPAEAIQRCERVLALEARHARAFACRGNALLQTEQYDAALSSYGQALELEPNSVETLCNHGTALRYLHRYADALQSYDAALAIDASFAEAWGNRSNVLQDMHRYEAAMTSLDRAIALRPEHAMHWFNRGNVLYEMGRPGAALQAYDKAIVLDHEFRDAHFARGSLHLVEGDFAAGWPEYEWRVRDPKGEQAKRIFAQPQWRGDESLKGKTIFVHAEQGFGDTLQFCRYVELLSARGADVVLEVQPALRSLMATLCGPKIVLSNGEAPPLCDFHSPLLSLPLALKTELQSIPNRMPYLFADPERVSQWQTRLGEKQKPRIGLAWSGNPEHRNDHNRSLGLSMLTPLLKLDVEWISLQKIVRGPDADLLHQTPIRSVEAELGDFADTAALIQTLDLVIAVDTAVAHLAGALGGPVWVLLPDPPEWRWLRERIDSPWYPGARLFRQSAPGQWEGVIGAVADEVQALL
jgi:tetratricopeptide (TPR) repeat protein